MNIIVTGASRGIGYATVLEFCKDSSHEVIAIARNKVLLKKLSDETFKINPQRKLFILPMDLENFSGEIIIKALHDFEWKHVDILINNAGTLINKPFENLTKQEWLHIYNVNVFSVVELIKTILPYVGKKNKGHIVNISSIGGVQGSTKFKGLSAYSSSKAALANLTECLAEEFKNKNIFVNCLALGGVQTEMFEQAFPSYKANVTAYQMAQYICNFALTGQNNMNGKIISVTLSTV